MTEKLFTKQEVYDGINRYKINESNFIVEILDDGIPMHYSTIVNRLNEQHKTITRLEKENYQLKQRNINQYNQLNKLWQLIEAKDWETLTEWIIKMKESEERLQQEWKCYE